MLILPGVFFFFFVSGVSWFLVSGLIQNVIVFGHRKFHPSILVDLNLDSILLSAEIGVIVILFFIFFHGEVIDYVKIYIIIIH